MWYTERSGSGSWAPLVSSGPQGGRVLESELRVFELWGEEGIRGVGRMGILPPEPMEY